MKQFTITKSLKTFELTPEMMGSDTDAYVWVEKTRSCVAYTNGYAVTFANAMSGAYLSKIAVFATNGNVSNGFTTSSITVNSIKVGTFYGGALATDAKGKILSKRSDVIKVHGGTAKSTLENVQATTVFGGGAGYGSVVDEVEMEIKGGKITTVYGAGSTGAVVAGDVDLKISGTDMTETCCVIKNIYAGGKSAKVYGNTKVTFTKSAQYLKFTGTVTGLGYGSSSYVGGTKTLVFDNYANKFNGTIKSFDAVEFVGSSAVILTKAQNKTMRSAEYKFVINEDTLGLQDAMLTLNNTAKMTKITVSIDTTCEMIAKSGITVTLISSKKLTKATDFNAAALTVTDKSGMQLADYSYSINYTAYDKKTKTGGTVTITYKGTDLNFIGDYDKLITLTDANDTVNIHANTLLRNGLNTAGGDDVVNVQTGATVNSEIALGTGKNELNVANGALINGNIRLTEGSENAIDLAGTLSGSIKTAAGVKNTITLNSAIIGNQRALVLGDSDDTVNLYGKTLVGDIDLGGGNDKLVLNNQSGNTNFTGDIIMGSGEDTLVINDANGLNRYDADGVYLGTRRVIFDNTVEGTDTIVAATSMTLDFQSIQLGSSKNNLVLADGVEVTGTGTVIGNFLGDKVKFGITFGKNAVLSVGNDKLTADFSGAILLDANTSLHVMGANQAGISDSEVRGGAAVDFEKGSKLTNSDVIGAKSVTFYDAAMTDGKIVADGVIVSNSTVTGADISGESIVLNSAKVDGSELTGSKISFAGATVTASTIDGVNCAEVMSIDADTVMDEKTTVLNADATIASNALKATFKNSKITVEDGVTATIGDLVEAAGTKLGAGSVLHITNQDTAVFGDVSKKLDFAGFENNIVLNGTVKADLAINGKTVYLNQANLGKLAISGATTLVIGNSEKFSELGLEQKSCPVILDLDKMTLDQDAKVTFRIENGKLFFDGTLTSAKEAQFIYEIGQNAGIVKGNAMTTGSWDKTFEFKKELSLDGVSSNLHVLTPKDVAVLGGAEILGGMVDDDRSSNVSIGDNVTVYGTDEKYDYAALDFTHGGNDTILIGAATIYGAINTADGAADTLILNGTKVSDTINEDTSVEVTVNADGNDTVMLNGAVIDGTVAGGKEVYASNATIGILRGTMTHFIANNTNWIGILDASKADLADFTVASGTTTVASVMTDSSRSAQLNITAGAELDLTANAFDVNGLDINAAGTLKLTADAISAKTTVAVDAAANADLTLAAAEITAGTDLAFNLAEGSKLASTASRITAGNNLLFDVAKDAQLNLKTSEITAKQALTLNASDHGSINVTDVEKVRLAGEQVALNLSNTDFKLGDAALVQDKFNKLSGTAAINLSGKASVEASAVTQSQLTNTIAFKDSKELDFITEGQYATGSIKADIIQEAAKSSSVNTVDAKLAINHNYKKGTYQQDGEDYEPAFEETLPVIETGDIVREIKGSVTQTGGANTVLLGATVQADGTYAENFHKAAEVTVGAFQSEVSGDITQTAIKSNTMQAGFTAEAKGEANVKLDGDVKLSLRNVTQSATATGATNELDLNAQLKADSQAILDARGRKITLTAEKLSQVVFKGTNKMGIGTLFYSEEDEKEPVTGTRFGKILTDAAFNMAVTVACIEMLAYGKDSKNVLQVTGNATVTGDINVGGIYEDGQIGSYIFGDVVTEQNEVTIAADTVEVKGDITLAGTTNTLTLSNASLKSETGNFDLNLRGGSNTVDLAVNTMVGNLHLYRMIDTDLIGQDEYVQANDNVQNDLTIRGVVGKLSIDAENSKDTILIYGGTVNGGIVTRNGNDIITLGNDTAAAVRGDATVNGDIVMGIKGEGDGANTLTASAFAVNGKAFNSIINGSVEMYADVKNANTLTLNDVMVNNWKDANDVIGEVAYAKPVIGGSVTMKNVDGRKEDAATAGNSLNLNGGEITGDVAMESYVSNTVKAGIGAYDETYIFDGKSFDTTDVIGGSATLSAKTNGVYVDKGGALFVNGLELNQKSSDTQALAKGSNRISVGYGEFGGELISGKDQNTLADVSMGSGAFEANGSTYVITAREIAAKGNDEITVVTDTPKPLAVTEKNTIDDSGRFYAKDVAMVAETNEIRVIGDGKLNKIQSASVDAKKEIPSVAVRTARFQANSLTQQGTKSNSFDASATGKVAVYGKDADDNVIQINELQGAEVKLGDVTQKGIDGNQDYELANSFKVGDNSVAEVGAVKQDATKSNVVDVKGFLNKYNDAEEVYNASKLASIDQKNTLESATETANKVTLQDTDVAASISQESKASNSVTASGSYKVYGAGDDKIISYRGNTIGGDVTQTGFRNSASLSKLEAGNVTQTTAVIQTRNSMGELTEQKAGGNTLAVSGQANSQYFSAVKDVAQTINNADPNTPESSIAVSGNTANNEVTGDTANFGSITQKVAVGSNSITAKGTVEKIDYKKQDDSAAQYDLVRAAKIDGAVTQEALFRNTVNLTNTSINGDATQTSAAVNSLTATADATDAVIDSTAKEVEVCEYHAELNHVNEQLIVGGSFNTQSIGKITQSVTAEKAPEGALEKGNTINLTNVKSGDLKQAHSYADNAITLKGVNAKFVEAYAGECDTKHNDVTKYAEFEKSAELSYGTIDQTGVSNTLTAKKVNGTAKAVTQTADKNNTIDTTDYASTTAVIKNVVQWQNEAEVLTPKRFGKDAVMGLDMDSITQTSKVNDNYDDQKTNSVKLACSDVKGDVVQTASGVNGNVKNIFQAEEKTVTYHDTFGNYDRTVNGTIGGGISQTGFENEAALTHMTAGNVTQTAKAVNEYDEHHAQTDQKTAGNTLKVTGIVNQRVAAGNLERETLDSKVGDVTQTISNPVTDEFNYAAYQAANTVTGSVATFGNINQTVDVGSNKATLTDSDALNIVQSANAGNEVTAKANPVAADITENGADKSDVLVYQADFQTRTVDDVTQSVAAEKKPDFLTGNNKIDLTNVNSGDLKQEHGYADNTISLKGGSVEMAYDYVKGYDAGKKEIIKFVENREDAELAFGNISQTAANGSNTLTANEVFGAAKTVTQTALNNNTLTASYVSAEAVKVTVANPDGTTSEDVRGRNYVDGLDFASITQTSQIGGNYDAQKSNIIVLAGSNIAGNVKQEAAGANANVSNSFAASMPQDVKFQAQGETEIGGKKVAKVVEYVRVANGTIGGSLDQSGFTNAATLTSMEAGNITQTATAVKSYDKDGKQIDQKAGDNTLTVTGFENAAVAELALAAEKVYAKVGDVTQTINNTLADGFTASGNTADNQINGTLARFGNLRQTVADGSNTASLISDSTAGDIAQTVTAEGNNSVTLNASVASGITQTTAKGNNTVSETNSVSGAVTQLTTAGNNDVTLTASTASGISQTTAKGVNTTTLLNQSMVKGDLTQVGDKANNFYMNDGTVTGKVSQTTETIGNTLNLDSVVLTDIAQTATKGDNKVTLAASTAGDITQTATAGSDEVTLTASTAGDITQTATAGSDKVTLTDSMAGDITQAAAIRNEVTVTANAVDAEYDEGKKTVSARAALNSQSIGSVSQTVEFTEAPQGATNQANVIALTNVSAGDLEQKHGYADNTITLNGAAVTDAEVYTNGGTAYIVTYGRKANFTFGDIAQEGVDNTLTATVTIAEAGAVSQIAKGNNTFTTTYAYNEAVAITTDEGVELRGENLVKSLDVDSISQKTSVSGNYAAQKINKIDLAGSTVTGAVEQVATGTNANVRNIFKAVSEGKEFREIASDKETVFTYTHTFNGTIGGAITQTGFENEAELKSMTAGSITQTATAVKSFDGGTQSGQKAGGNTLTVTGVDNAAVSEKGWKAATLLAVAGSVTQTISNVVVNAEKEGISAYITEDCIANNVLTGTKASFKAISQKVDNGNNTLTLTDSVVDGDITLTNTNASLVYNITGGTTTDTFNSKVSVTGSTITGNITTSVGNDAVTLSGSTITGNIDTGAGINNTVTLTETIVTGDITTYAGTASGGSVIIRNDTGAADESFTKIDGSITAKTVTSDEKQIHARSITADTLEMTASSKRVFADELNITSFSGGAYIQEYSSEDSGAVDYTFGSVSGCVIYGSNELEDKLTVNTLLNSCDIGEAAHLDASKPGLDIETVVFGGSATLAGTCKLYNVTSLTFGAQTAVTGSCELHNIDSVDLGANTSITGACDWYWNDEMTFDLTKKFTSSAKAGDAFTIGTLYDDLDDISLTMTDGTYEYVEGLITGWCKDGEYTFGSAYITYADNKFTFNK